MLTERTGLSPARSTSSTQDREPGDTLPKPFRSMLAKSSPRLTVCQAGPGSRRLHAPSSALELETLSLHSPGLPNWWGEQLSDKCGSTPHPAGGSSQGHWGRAGQNKRAPGQAAVSSGLSCIRKDWLPWDLGEFPF
jgi:hypothetical protein